jgi:hypothetical protein
MKFIRFFIPRIEYILFTALFWSITASGPKILNFDGDLPRHLLMGKLILQNRHVSTVDIFSFRTEGYPSIPHEWLSQVIFAGVYQSLGLNGIVLITAFIIMLVWAVVFHVSINKSDSLFSSLLFTALAAGASQIHVLPRPHIFTYLLTAIWIVMLERIDKDHNKAWWTLPILMLVWVNLHGMFILGIILWGIYLVGSFLDNPSRAWFSNTKTRSMIFAGTLSLAATFLSPSGFHIWGAIASLGSNSYITSKIPEYQSANFHLPETWPFILILLFTITGFARANKIGWTPILLTVTFTFLALYTSRMIPLFAIVITPVTAETIAKWIREEFPQSRFATFEGRIAQTNLSANGWIWVALVVIGTAILLQSGNTISPDGKSNIFDEHFFPVDAVDWLEAHPQNGHMFNEFDWGGYILLRLWPGQQIFMDGHTHIYGEQLTREYERVITLGDGWENILDRYQVEWAILWSGSLLAQELQNSNWETLHQDDTAVILRKR